MSARSDASEREKRTHEGLALCSQGREDRLEAALGEQVLVLEAQAMVSNDDWERVSTGGDAHAWP